MKGAFKDSSIKIHSGTLPPLVMRESRCSSWSNSGRLKTPGSNLSRFSQENQEFSSYTMARDNWLLSSNRRPVLSEADQNSETASHFHDKKFAEHDDTGSSLINGEEQDRWVNSTKEIWNGMKDCNIRRRSESPLKRRRPPRLEISQSTIRTASPLQIVQFHEDTPKEICVEGSNYAVACKKGRRDLMEDTYTVMTGVSGDPSQALFGVFDGHGGRKAAEFAAENLGRNIIDRITELREGYGEMEDGVRSGYLITDEAFSKENLSGGTCCVTAMMKRGHMIVANAGDCRAVLSVKGNAEALTCDHKIEREDERQRIEHLGGYVDCHNGVWRVQGSLAVSRSIGDTRMKKWISAEPEIKKLKITSDFEFLILASDGMWDKVGNQEAVDIARSFSVGKSPNPMAACRELVEVAVRRGSKDDITVMMVDLRSFCK